MDITICFGFVPICFNHRTSGNIEQGRKLFAAEHVVDLKERAGEITARVIRQASVSLKPYAVSLVLNSLREVVSAHCECVAGVSGSCKHISAVVFAVNEEDCTTKTSKPCEWNKPGSSKIGQLKYTKGQKFVDVFPVTQATPKKQRRGCTEMSPDTPTLEKIGQGPSMLRTMLEAEDTINNQVSERDHAEAENHMKIKWKILIDSQNSSILLDELSKETFSISHDCCINTFNQHLMGDAYNICASTLKNKQKWLEERKYRITASRCYSLFTYAKNDWMALSNKYFWPKSFDNKYTQHGRKWENEARLKYSEYTDNTVIETGLLVCQTDRWLAASPDGVVFYNETPQKLIEIKCPYEGRNKSASEIDPSCRYLQRENGVLTLKKKNAYYAQVQVGMAILNVTSCDFIIFCSFDKSFIIIPVEFDYKYTKQLLFKLKTIYLEKMLPYICDNCKNTRFGEQQSLI